MIDVVYYWSEDGEAERCKLEYATADADVRCYHCDAPIEKESVIAKFFTRTEDVYILHEACAKKGCNFTPKRRVKPTKSLRDFVKEWEGKI